MQLKPNVGQWLPSALIGFALAVGADRALAQSDQDYIVSLFDDGTTQGWNYNYGGAHCTTEFDPGMNRGPVGGGEGSMKVTIPFDLSTLAGDNQTDFETALPAPLDLTKFTQIHFSVYVDPSSAHLSGWGNSQLGPIRPHIRQPNWSGDVSINPSSDSQWVGADYGTWHDYVMPIDQTVAANQATLANTGILGLQMWSGWDGVGLTNQVIFWLDNVWFEDNTNTAPTPPPVVSLSKAGIPGVRISMDGSGGQWDRQAISTPAPNASYIWTAQGGYPVSYSLTITDFPSVAPHLGYEAHMYIVNQDTAPAGNDTGGSPDWACPDLFIFRIENHVTTSYTTNADIITTNLTYDAMAQIQWKTNYPNANATNVPVLVFPPSALGTWTVTFTDATHGSLSGPGMTSADFTLPDEAVANSFSPSASFVQFGCFKNDGNNDGHNNDASGAFSHVAISGTANPIDDDFSGTTLTNKYAWRKTSDNEVLYIAPGTAWFIKWSLPAFGFNPAVAPSVTGPWTQLAASGQYQVGTNTIGGVLASALPQGNKAFFQMVKYPFVKLQVLMPGETSAPNTPTGKTGTPTVQAAGVAFNVTVNAVDQYWNVVPATDEIAITSSDSGATLPANAKLANGSQIFSVMLNTTSPPDSTVTATDVTDSGKTAGTGSPTTVQ